MDTDKEQTTDIDRYDLDGLENLLSKIKFKVLFSSDLQRQNLKDYIIRIYKALPEHH